MGGTASFQAQPVYAEATRLPATQNCAYRSFSGDFDAHLSPGKGVFPAAGVPEGPAATFKLLPHQKPISDNDMTCLSPLHNQIPPEGECYSRLSTGLSHYAEPPNRASSPDARPPLLPTTFDYSFDLGIDV